VLCLPLLVTCIYRRKWDFFYRVTVNFLSMTLTFESDLARVKVNQRAKYKAKCYFVR